MKIEIKNNSKGGAWIAVSDETGNTTVALGANQSVEMQISDSHYEHLMANKPGFWNVRVL